VRLRVANPLIQTTRRRTQRGRGICSLDPDAAIPGKSRRSICFLEDALLDLTNCGDTVVDPFLGSGSILIAEKTEPVCHGVEVDPLYVDVIARRYEAATGDAPTLVETGGTFEALGARRATEAAPVQGSSSGAPSEVSPELPEAVAPSSARVPQWMRSEVRIP
jgi:hypothetical protein